jgi:PST family polysaccharide transporter
MAGLMYLLAPHVAGLFKINELESILAVFSLMFPIRSISLVAESLLQREVKFRILAGIDVLSYLLGYGIVGIALAVTGFGVWSLVAANLSQTILKSILLLRSQPHPKRVRIDRQSFQDLMYFGGGFIAGRICNALARQGDFIVVARCLGAASLGIYQRAYQFMAMPANVFGLALDKVLFPVMAKLQNDPAKLRKAYRAGVMLIALLVLPISAIMYHLAPEIISVLLGDQWIEVVVPFRILALGMLFRTSYKMSDSLARATGSVYRRAWRQGIYAALVFCGAWVGQFWGVPGVAYGILWAIFVNFLLMAQLSLKITSMTWREFISAHMPASILSLIVWFVISGSASMLRHVEMSKMSILAIPLLGVLITLLLLFRYMPKRILGEEGMHICSQLVSRVTSNLNFLKTSRDRHAGSERFANVK